MANDLERPTIVIGSIDRDGLGTEWLKPLLNGIEEEQIPFSLQSIAVKDTVSRAYQAALASRLSVGIAYDNKRYVIHYKNLPEQEPLFDVTVVDAKQLRALGANAARLVKGIPFKNLS
ncbi:MAG: glycerol dehydratase reactivase beta/small subunit family protein [Levilactobacillus sp.]|uniref:glycerol dehydratase reactivase beta/small subunit family protein n=1 Tax=Levilactobacillus sp. TaxID=2767919 RepID=UPI00258C5631|nr:glycerol dehydratase reactivase beta/small subunit family protein [Levilactobacillus sp.]MCI1553205.1 glycerol dehydratase reactivase beta/small subunit family protein [Levilactobacillus sp.]